MAVVSQVFSLLSKRLGVALECFASPLNTFLGRFCSAFPDVDSAFGSQGSFWSFSPDSGSFQVRASLLKASIIVEAPACYGESLGATFMPAKEIPFPVPPSSALYRQTLHSCRLLWTPWPHGCRSFFRLHKIRLHHCPL